ncbi:probable amino acid permease 7 [Carica papaya]|uniref:probable amino acid permease 7 n=1 Tax=Carica papaya TaxID=3649 RepID=UPI000B8C930E|nr:probable amino acid permease 7 [Carica papaya]
MGVEGQDFSPLMGSSSSSLPDHHGAPKRTGTIWTATAHIITGVIGAGVLSLAWCIAQVGWLAGPALLLVFAAVTLVSAFLLSDCSNYPDPNLGSTRIKSYTQAVNLFLGDKFGKVCLVLVDEGLYGCCIAYTITASTSLRAIQRANCYHREGHQAPCVYGSTVYMVVFGLIQVVMSQIPDLHNMQWVSVIAAIMSFAYSFVGLGLAFAQVLINGRIKGSITGVPASSTANKLWLIFQALGNIAFAYAYSIILLEIQDTLKSTPPENKVMKKASVLAIFITTFFYLCCGCFGYAAFGSLTPGNILSGFGFYEPYWLIDFANICIVVHLIGGYQIYSQPVFASIERWAVKKFPESGFVNKFYCIKHPWLPSFQTNLFNLCFRTIYVASTTALAMVFPYFNQVLGVLGALNFWPLAIYFPVEMYLVQNKIAPWTRKWIVLKIFSCICLIITLLCLIGSVQGFISVKFR